MNWKDELKKECRKKFTNNFTNNNEFIEQIIMFDKFWGWIDSKIESLLKNKRDKYYYEIENSTGTKEADYIDKQVNGGSDGLDM